MRRDELEELHFITHVDNLSSILEHGILSHRRVREIEHVSVAMQEIQDRRAVVVVPGGRPLHEYANLYINARNKMMYKLHCTNRCRGVCIVRVEVAVLDLPGVVIADMNASSDYVAFRPAPQGLQFVTRDRVFAQSWVHADEIERLRN